MAIKKRAEIAKSAMTQDGKLQAYEAIFKQCGRMLVTAPPFRDKKNNRKAKTVVSYREWAEWVEEIDRLYDIMPSSTYESRADFYRCINRVAIYMATLLMGSYANEHGLPDKAQELNECLRFQTMLNRIAREDMIGSVSEQYSDIRRSYIERNPVNLSRKLHEIEQQEARHVGSLAMSVDEEDRIMNATLFGSGYFEFDEGVPTDEELSNM